MMATMSDLFGLMWHAMVDLFRPRAALQAQILILRHRINILRRRSPKRATLGNIDRAVLIGLYRLAPTVLETVKIINPDTLVRWHRAGFRAYWRWKSRPHGGRPKTPADIRRLIREMSIANPLWGAPRIHGELLKIGIDVGQTSVAKYMARRRGPPSQGWKTFLRNHANGIALMEPICRSDDVLSTIVRAADPAARPSEDCVAWRHQASNGRVDRSADNGSLRLGNGTSLSAARS